MTRPYQICTRCIMDTTDIEIQFDEQGICNYCKKYDKRAQNELHLDAIGQQKLARLIDEIKNNGKNKEYNCIIGLSGGTDSTMVAHIVKEKLGLKPLAITVNNGWNTELAEKNIENLVKKLNIDLYTHVLDWEEFKDVQLSFLKASVANCEAPTDHAIQSLLFHTAAQRGIPYIISGGNLVTEAIMPPSWGYCSRDWKQIKGIHKKFGKEKLKTFPHLTLFNWIYYTFIKGIKFIPILNYFPYIKKDVKQFLEKELSWKDYGAKHFESIYTRFFQAYILPVKFGFDKRRAHLSTLICSGQTSREEAIEEMKLPPYSSTHVMEKDKELVLKKLGLTEKGFEDIMSSPIKTYKDYPNYDFLYRKLDFIVRFAHRVVTHNR